jgi:uncharacterized protein (TIGR02231 family)
VPQKRTYKIQIIVNAVARAGLLLWNYYLSISSLKTHLMIQQRIAFITGFTLLLANTLQAQIQQKLNIDRATVFLNGAELTSSAKLTLVKGENEIMFTNVAGDVNSQSLTINATNGVVVESATFQNNYLATENLSPRAKEIKDSIELITDNRGQVSNKIAVLNEQIAVLQGNRKVSGENTGLSVAELAKMLDLINTRMENYLDQKNKQDKTLKRIDERLVKLKMQLDEEQKKDYQPGGQLLVKFYAKEATATAVNIDYIVPHAGWSPAYDIWADDVNGPIKLYYKANIYQNSGVKWNNVRLSLSTGNPNEGVQAPVMNPWYLAFYTPQVYNRQLSYNNSNMPTTQMSDMAAAAPGTYQKASGAEQASMNNYVSVDNSGINTTFDIELPYTIPSDGQQHLVAVKRYELPATYRYYTVPKLDKDAFLQANITNWEDLNLLPGQTNIFYEGTYVGQGTIDVRNVKDTMTISLGRDKKIVTKRERDVKLRSVKTIGTNIRETFAYTITVRNTRKESINIVVQDQQPVSNDKDIVIEDKDAGNSEYDETTGMMRWTLSLAPNETKKIGFGYTIKYPKGKTIANMR